MVEIKADNGFMKVTIDGYEEDVLIDACMAIGAAIKVLRELNRDKKFCRGACEIALDHYFEKEI